MVALPDSSALDGGSEFALLEPAAPARRMRAPVRSHASHSAGHCPHCHSDVVVRWGRKNGSHRFRCNRCTRTFTALTNTGLAHLRHRERWISFLGAMIEQKSLREAAAICDISLGTAQRWRNRLREYVASQGVVGLMILDSLQELLSRL